MCLVVFFFFKQKTAYEMRISDWSSDVCSSDLPGVEPTEMSQGLYPQAPVLAEHHDLTPAQQFWIIKHGIKMTAMPAWGKTHPDPLIWDMVAFVRKLTGMSPTEYKQLVASAPAAHHEMMAERKTTSLNTST